jgi:hypothetical protein
LVEKLQIASEGLILTESQQRILAHRLTREFVAMQPDIISVAKLRELIDKSLVGIPGVIPRIEISEDASSAILKPEDAAMTEIGEDAYRANHIVKQD